jgi:UDPglucose 6-dehydrogenase
MIGVIGLGFVGLTTATGFAHRTSHPVWGYEKDAARRQVLQRGEVPFHEPGLPEHLRLYLGGKLQLPDSIEALVKNSRVIFICVGTPADEQGKADLTFLRDALREVLRLVQPGDYKVLVVKSTVPPSTTATQVTATVRECGFEPGRDIGIANNPEFLREGCSWEDFIHPDRIVIGQYDDRSGETVEKIYQDFGAPIARVSLNTGEYIKYLSNTLLATLISYSNEMAMAADHIGGIDVRQAFRILHQDRRWSGQPAKMSTYAYPGCGFGGYCLPKDTQAFITQSAAHGFETDGLRRVLDINREIRAHTVAKTARLCSSQESVIGILGLSFKPGSDDVRDTPVKYLIEGLLNAGYSKLLAYDPLAMAEFRRHYRYPIEYAESLNETLDRSEVILLATAWPEFIAAGRTIAAKKYVDARFCLDQESL